MASESVSHILVTMEASEPTDSERSGNCKMLIVSFTQLVSSVKKWSPSRRTSTTCVIQGGLYLNALALSLRDILKAVRAFSFVRGERVCQIYGSSSGL